VVVGFACLHRHVPALHDLGQIGRRLGGTLTGRGADLIVIDDPLNAAEAQSESARKRVIDWYGGALVSRLNDKRTGTGPPET
jgi:hypothetical protein